MLTNTRIFTRLSALAGLLLATIAFMAVTGSIDISRMQASIKTVYEDRTVPLAQLTQIQRAYFEVRIEILQTLNTGDAAAVPAREAVIEKKIADAKEAWAAYMATYLTPEEKKLAAQAASNFDRYNSIRPRVLGFAKAGDFQNARALAGSEAGAAVAAIMASLTDLVNLQVDVAKAEYEKAQETAKTDQLMLYAETGLALAFGALLAYVIARSITTPLRQIIDVMQSLTRGELNVEVTGQARGDEIGAVAKAVAVFKDGMAEAERLRQDQVRLKEDAERERKQSMLKMADDFENTVGGIVKTVAAAATELQASAESLSASARNTADRSASVATASQQVSANVQTVAAASEEMNQSVNEISRQLANSRTMTAEAVTEAERTNAQVTELASAARKINDIIKLISDIAEQTNLLALNATIEAARAGEAGKGFAVVADEVKNLARQTAKATDEISSQVTGIQQTTESSVQAIRKIASTIDALNGVSTTIAAAVEEQSASTHEIARNVQHAAQGTGEVSQGINTVNQGVDITGNAANDMLGAAKELSMQSERLDSEVGMFLATIRRAANA